MKLRLKANKQTQTFQRPDAAYDAAPVLLALVVSETSTLYKYSAATQGFLLWTSWAFYVNYKTSISAGVKAGLVQGIFSFVSTLIVISVLTKMFNHIKQPLLKLIAPTAIMVMVLTLILVTAHTIAETPKIIKTIVPSLFIAILFCSFTTYKLNNAKTHIQDTKLL